MIVNNIRKVIKLFYFKTSTLALNTSNFPSGIDILLLCAFLQLKFALEVKYVIILWLLFEDFCEASSP